MPTTLWPSLTISERPCAIPSVPSVATNGGMPTTETSQPLRVPNARPAMTAAATPISIDPVASDTMATNSEVSVSTAPIERSSPSVMMISVIGSASIIRMVDCTSTLEMLVGDRNPGAMAPNTTTSSPSTIATPGMRCSGWAGSVAAISRMMHPQFHDVFLGEFGARQLTGDTAFAHHISAVTDMADFSLLRRNHQCRRAACDELIDQCEDLGLGADVDATRRLVE